MTPMMFWPVSVVASCAATSSATLTWRWCCLLLLPCELAMRRPRYSSVTTLFPTPGRGRMRKRVRTSRS